jgi:glycosyltransferase involved in cell wall biosynthesis
MTSHGQPEFAVVVLAAPPASSAFRTMRNVDQVLGSARLSVERHLLTFSAHGSKATVLPAAQVRWAEAQGWAVSERASTGGSLLAGSADLVPTDFVAVLPSGTYVGPGWLTAAVSLARTGSEAVLVHPQFILEYGAGWHLRQFPESAEVPLAGLLLDPVWTETLVAPVALLRELGSRSGSWAGEECHGLSAPQADQWLVAQAIAAGARVITARGSVAVRRVVFAGQHPARHALLPPVAGLHLEAEVRLEAPRPAARSTVGERIDRMRARAARRGRDLVVRHPALLPLGSRARPFLAGVGGVTTILEPRFVDDLRSVAEVEPLVHPARIPGDVVRTAIAPDRIAAPALDALLREIPPEASHVFVVPWLRVGGADLEVLNYCAALTRMGARLAVIGTEDGPSPWSSRLPRGVPFVNAGEVLRGLPLESAARVLASALVQCRAERVHVVNSSLAYTCLELYGSALRLGAKLFASVFCEDIGRSGERRGYVVDRLPQVIDHLDAVFADNQRVLQLVRSMTGIDAGNLHVHYQPASDTPPTRRDARLEGTLRVLWAGRLDRQKRPDILAAVADACADLPIEFEAFGYQLLDPAGSRSDLERSNLVHRGSFENFAHTDPERFDVFLLTSEWEGLPNVLLEAIAFGLAIVAPDVGGVREIVADGHSGVLIPRFDDIGAYRRALARLAQERSTVERLAAGGRAALELQHTWQTFEAALRDCPGYAP